MAAEKGRCRADKRIDGRKGMLPGGKDIAGAKRRDEEEQMAEKKGTDQGNANPKKSGKTLSIEENFAKLEEAIGRLENEDTSLEEAFAAYSEGMKLVKACNDQIDRVEKQVLKLTQEGALEPFDALE